MVVFLTNFPSFYKNRLFTEVNKVREVVALYTGIGKEERNKDFFSAKRVFSNRQLTGRLLKDLCVIHGFARHCEELVVCGWESPVYLLAVLLVSRRKISCLVESSIYDSTTKGVKGLMKRLFLKRVSKVYAAGNLQYELVKALGFKGKVVEVGGCGLLHYVKQPAFERRDEAKRYLYVGRFSREKNLRLLIEAFNEMSELSLDIVGFGAQESELKSLSQSNIHFLGVIKNTELSSIYQSHDVFILPSISEPWGLVVEEALNNGTPVIVSDRVGCKDDLVTPETGLVFHYDDKESLKSAVLKTTDVDFYNKLRLGVSKMDFKARAQRQVEAFLSD